ncbi:MAG: (d)CMP kinase, partial [Novosphingobium sp.]
VTASVSARAMRRWVEMKQFGKDVERAEIETDLEARDERDRNRTEAPLRQADGAAALDTSNLTKEMAVATAIALVEKQIAGKG